MNNKIGFAAVLSIGLVALQAQAGVKYDVEFTNAWFTVSASTLPSGAISGTVEGEGVWTRVPSEEDNSAVVADGKINLDTTVGDALVFTPSRSNSVPVSRIASTIKVTQSSDLPDPSAELIGAKTAFCVCTNASGQVKWFALASGAWQELSGTPEIDHVYEIVLETDVDLLRIRYLVKDITAGDSAYTVVSGGWIPDSVLTTQISSVAFSGTTEINGFSGNEIVGSSSVLPDVVVPVTNAAASSVTVTKSWISEKMGLDVTTAAGLAEAVSKINDTPTSGNGMTYWQSYVLGLTPSDATSKPIVQPVQNTSATKVAFSLGNVAVKGEAGVTVKYRVNTFSNPACTQGKVEGSLVNSDATAELDLPTEAGAKYYKVEIKFGD